MLELVQDTHLATVSDLLDPLYYGYLVWIFLALVTAALCFPRDVAPKNLHPLPIRLLRPVRLKEWCVSRLTSSLAGPAGDGLSPEAKDRARVLETLYPFLTLRIWMGKIIIIVLSGAPFVAVQSNAKAQEFLDSGVSQWVLFLVAVLLLAPFLLVPALSLLALRGGDDRLWPLEMLIWRRLRDLVKNDLSTGGWWRQAAVRRTTNLSALSALIRRDVSRFGRGTTSEGSTTQADEVARWLAALSDRVARHPSRALNPDSLGKFLDVWLLGKWNELPRVRSGAPGEPLQDLPRPKSTTSAIVVSLVIFGLVLAVAYPVIGSEKWAALVSPVWVALAVIFLIPLRKRLEK